MRKGLGVKGAIVVSGIIFGLMHMSPWRFVPQALLGILLAILVLRSGSLWTAIIVHIGHNALLITIVVTAQEHLSEEAMAQLEQPRADAISPLATASIGVIAAALIFWGALALLRRLPALPKD